MSIKMNKGAIKSLKKSPHAKAFCIGQRALLALMSEMLRQLLFENLRYQKSDAL
jgi:hypothetical protein